MDDFVDLKPLPSTLGFEAGLSCCPLGTGSHQRLWRHGRFESIKASVRSDFDLADIAKRGANMFLQMIFRDGFYHADPHPGNLMVLPDSAVGLLDCGMVGRVDEELREQIEDLLMAAIDRDSKRLQECVVELGESIECTAES